MDDRDLYELIDGWHPSADDADDGALGHRLADDPRAAELHGRMQRADMAISEALQDVPVPEALGDRILAALKAARLGDTLEPTATEAAIRSAPGTPSPLSAHSARRSKRSIWRIVAAVSVAAACAAFWIVHFRHPANVTIDEIAADVESAFVQKLAVSDPAWSMEESNEPAFKIPYVIHDGFRTIVRSRRLSVGGYHAVAHELMEPFPADLPPQLRKQFPKRVTLIVIERRVGGLSYLPSEPRDTHGRFIGVWQSDRFVYALVVEGTEEQYRAVFRDTALG